MYEYEMTLIEPMSRRRASLGNFLERAGAGIIVNAEEEESNINGHETYMKYP